MTGLERGVFVKLFNRGGYVLDFSTPDFDAFTLESVGVAVCAKYGLSKGKSMIEYLQDADPKLGDKLLFDLLNYYELSYEAFERETIPDENGKLLLGFRNLDYSVTYKKCKSIQAKYIAATSYYSNATQDIREAFSSEYIDKQISLMLSMQRENPTEAIGKAKELIESCCKAIYDARGIEYDPKWEILELTQRTRKLLKITPEDIDVSAKGAKAIKTLLGSLGNIAQCITELRNDYGSGHGKSPTYKGLEERHAKLAVGSTITLVNFLWDSHLRILSKQDQREND